MLVKLDNDMSKKANRSIFITSTKLSSKWIKDLGIRPDTLNLIEEKVENSLELIVTGKDFLDRTPLVRGLISMTKKWNFM
ncbi:hypothetical protein STEG23_010920 [Scotinomys teguina]